MSYEQWAKQHNSNGELLEDCWNEAQVELLSRLEKKLGDNYGFIAGRFYYKMSDVLKEL